MSNKAIKILPSVTAPLPVGKNYRILCLTGENKGKAYLVSNERATLGRSPDADITIFDVKSSKLHAELKKMGDTYILTDLGSRNGIFVNDLKIKQHTLSSGDKFVIGHTVYKYEEIVIDEKIDIELVEDSEEDDRPKGDPKKAKRVLIILFIGLFAIIMLDDAPQKSVQKKKRSLEEIMNSRHKTSVLKRSETLDPEIRSQLESVIHRGQREFREKNYFRAMSEFRHALILDPENSTAQFYLRVTEQSLNEEIEMHFTSAKNAIDALKYSSAIIHYCTVIRILQDSPENKDYKKALESLSHLELEMGKKKGEINCI